jgi:hypothetical protein
MRIMATAVEPQGDGGCVQMTASCGINQKMVALNNVPVAQWGMLGTLANSLSTGPNDKLKTTTAKPLGIDPREMRLGFVYRAARGSNVAVLKSGVNGGGTCVFMKVGIGDRITDSWISDRCDLDNMAEILFLNVTSSQLAHAMIHGSSDPNDEIAQRVNQAASGMADMVAQAVPNPPTMQDLEQASK